VFHGNIGRIGLLGSTLDAEVVDVVHAVSETVRGITAYWAQILGDEVAATDAREKIDDALVALGILRGRLDKRAKGRPTDPVPLPPVANYTPPHPPAPE
jgi:hypothetical protein